MQVVEPVLVQRVDLPLICVDRFIIAYGFRSRFPSQTLRRDRQDRQRGMGEVYKALDTRRTHDRKTY